MKNLTAPELSAWLAETNSEGSRVKPFLLDVREPWEFETCHIDGAMLIPMQSIPSRLSELATDAAIVCICHHGTRSMNVAGFLEKKGYTNISNLAGGINAWSRLVDPSIPTY
jgi:rhodanese-related sulfurtransferase